MNLEQQEYIKARANCWLLIRHKLKIRPAYFVTVQEESEGVIPTNSPEDKDIIVSLVILSKSYRPFPIKVNLEDLKKNTISATPYSGFALVNEEQPVYFDLKPNRQYLKAINLRDIILQYPYNPDLHAYWQEWSRGLTTHSTPHIVKVFNGEDSKRLRSMLYSYITRAEESFVFETAGVHLLEDIRARLVESALINRNLAIDKQKIVYKGEIIGDLTKGLHYGFEIYSNYINKSLGFTL